MHWLSWTLAAALATEPSAANESPASVDPPVAPVPIAATPTSAPSPRPPEEPSFKRKTAYGLLLGGAAATLGFVWVGGMIGAAYRDSKNWRDRDVGTTVAIPFAGPFIAARRDGLPVGEKVAFAALGLQQWAAVAVMMAGGIGVSEHRKYERHYGIEHRPDKSTILGLTVAGLAGLTMSYGMTVGFSTGDRRAGGPYGRQFLVPFVGGFMAAPHAPNNRVAVAAMTSSAVQIASAAAATTGIALAVRRKRLDDRLTVTPSVGREHAFVSATLRF